MPDAQARVIAIMAEGRDRGVGECVIDWTEPLCSARIILEHTYQLSPSSANKTRRIADALLAYAAHLSFMAGRAHELAAVLRYGEHEAANYKHKADNEAHPLADRAAAELRHAVIGVFVDEVRDGIHHAEPAEGQ